MSWTVRLRTQAFNRAALLAGFPSVYALAQAMRVERSTVHRVLNGEQRPGPAFIGGALMVLKPMDFGDLFEVVSKPL
ncbi:transcriptional regulator [Saccharothrix australiensis]|uniref:Helix-turn-helix protein n=1 Tax=Saccharothrix australiensis TaxID=2072 RepID=A0A495VUE0_9PSEU|nr:transcriptional regulator [Saccharothrix australiensis]RKT53021.1 hypothetical protein C8E97_1565 [Saccharothrix australiensis]